MVSHKARADPLGGLLSSVNGIDSSLFEHKALKDVHKTDSVQSSSRSASTQSMGALERDSAVTDKAMNRSPQAGPVRPSPPPSTSWSHSSTSMGSRAKGSQFDALLGDLTLNSSTRWLLDTCTLHPWLG
jgi:hypothetical protein